MNIEDQSWFKGTETDRESTWTNWDKNLGVVMLSRIKMQEQRNVLIRGENKQEIVMLGKIKMKEEKSVLIRRESS